MSTTKSTKVTVTYGRLIQPDGSFKLIQIIGAQSATILPSGAKWEPIATVRGSLVRL